jgi:Zn-dependent protease
LGVQDPVLFLLRIIVILVSLALHEYGHAKLADAAGDPTPRMMGRVSLNPLVHLDPMGTVMIVFTAIAGFGIGWGKPVIVRVDKMRNPRWDHFWSVLAGPLMNLLQAAAYAVILRLYLGPVRVIDLVGILDGSYGYVQAVLLFGILINLSLCFFNLIPLGPLDGHWLVGTFMNEKTRVAWYMWNRKTGTLVLFALLIIGWFQPSLSFISIVLFPVVERVFRFLMGLG